MCGHGAALCYVGVNTMCAPPQFATKDSKNNREGGLRINVYGVNVCGLWTIWRHGYVGWSSSLAPLRMLSLSLFLLLFCFGFAPCATYRPRRTIVVYYSIPVTAGLDLGAGHSFVFSTALSIQ